MSSFASKIRREFGARKSKKIFVPEWELTIFVFPLTLGQLSRIREETDYQRRLCRALLVRARDEKGEPIFDAEDMDALFDQGVDRYGIDVVTRVVSEMAESEDDLAAANGEEEALNVAAKK